MLRILNLNELNFKSILHALYTYIYIYISGGTSNRKLELSVAGASDPSTRVQKLIAWKLRDDDILIATHASDACVA